MSSRDENARKAVETWTKKFTDAQRQAGKSPNATEARQRATEAVRRVVRKQNEK